MQTHKATLHKVFIAKEMLLCQFGVADGSALVSGTLWQAAVFLSSLTGQMGLPCITSPLLGLKMVTQKFFSIRGIIIYSGSDLACL